MMLLFLQNGRISTVTLVINKLLVKQLQQMTVLGKPVDEVWPRTGAYVGDYLAAYWVIDRC